MLHELGDDGGLVSRGWLRWWQAVAAEDLVIGSASTREIRRGWFGHGNAHAEVALTFEYYLGQKFDPAILGRGLSTEATD